MLFFRYRTLSKPPPVEVNLESLGVFLELAFGISAWKSMGPARWALRNHPSSGNLHPSEVYLILWQTLAPKQAKRPYRSAAGTLNQ